MQADEQVQSGTSRNATKNPKREYSHRSAKCGDGTLGAYYKKFLILGLNLRYYMLN